MENDIFCSSCGLEIEIDPDAEEIPFCPSCDEVVCDDCSEQGNNKYYGYCPECLKNKNGETKEQ